MHIHILGICGTFMGGIAQLAKQLGHHVTGCDQNVYPPMSDQLQSLGIELHQGYDAQQIDEYQADHYIIGNTLKRGLPVVERLLEQRQELISGPQWFSEHVLSQQKTIIGVSGTHGKTTTASLIAWLLADNDYQPGFLIGGVPRNFGISAQLGKGDVFVIEADEYDSAFFDKRSKFIHYRPDILVINNIEFDHADIFTDIEDIKRQFHHLLKIMPNSANVIANADDEHIDNLLNMGLWSKLNYFGVKKHQDTDYVISGKDSHHYQIDHNNSSFAAYSVLVGNHNQLNNAAAIAACHVFGLAIDKAISSAKNFMPPKRRLQLKFENDLTQIYDDFAHHPTAITKTIEAVKQNCKGKLIVVFEPRSNSMRSGAHNEGLSTSFAKADLVYMYNQSAESSAFQFLLKAYPKNFEILNSTNTIIERLVDLIGDKVTIIFMSNGGFENIVKRFIDTIDSQ